MHIHRPNQITVCSIDRPRKRLYSQQLSRSRVPPFSRNVICGGCDAVALSPASLPIRHSLGLRAEHAGIRHTPVVRSAEWGSRDQAPGTYA